MQDVNNARFDRVKLIFGDDFDKIFGKKVLVCGLGGVGGMCFDALYKNGVDVNGIDFDSFELSNQNRQLHSQNVGLKKAEVFASFYGAKCYGEKITKDFLQTHKDEFQKYEVIIDCVDDIDAKVELAFFTHFNKIKFFSSGGGAKRLDISKIKIADYDKTYGDALCKKFKLELKKRDFRGKFKMVFSDESPACSSLGSFMPVTASFGLNLASLCINYLRKKQ